mgnify:CR=1 FL=1
MGYIIMILQILRFMVIKSDIPVQSNEKSSPVEADSNVAEAIESIGISEEITESDKVTELEVDEDSGKEHEEESG